MKGPPLYLLGAVAAFVLFIHLRRAPYRTLGVSPEGATSAGAQAAERLPRLPDLGSASRLVERACATYRVECVPGSSPAAGRIVGLVPTPPAREFCRGHGDVEPGAARVKCACPAEPLRSAVRPRDTECDAGAHYLAHQCSSVPFLPPAAERAPGGPAARRAAPGDDAAGVDVLLVVSECLGHGLFAQVERVLNQLRYAASRGLVPAVYLGEHVFTSLDDCLGGKNGYWDANALRADSLDSVWCARRARVAQNGDREPLQLTPLHPATLLSGQTRDYYFEPVSPYRLGAPALPNGSRVRSVQVASIPLLYKDQRLGGFDNGRLITAYGRTDIYEPDWWLDRRRTAHAYLQSHVRVRAELLARAAAVRAGWLRARGGAAPLLGVHLRGTDKVVRRKVQPERYYRLVDAFVAAHPRALIFVATDDVRYLRAMVSRYGDAVVYRQAGYRSDNVIRDERLAPREKGADALLDALLLSGCDFLLKTTSALSEFAIWLNLSLHERHIDLQFEDGGASQALPRWASHLAAPAKVRSAARRRQLLRRGGGFLGGAS